MILGLDEITFGELKSNNARLVESLREKLGDLDAQKFPDAELARKVNLLTELLRESLLGRYQDLTVRAFAHIAVALDYFLVIHEQEPGSVRDTLPGGYVDDLVRINEVFRRFAKELDAFEAWRARQPKS